MKIYKKEREVLIQILMLKHEISRQKAKEIIDEDNSYMKELTSKLRKENNRKKKDKTKRFGEEFEKMKRRR